MHSFSSLFNPQSVAIMGISENSTKLGSIIANNMQKAGYKKPLFGINPKYNGERVQNIPTFANISNVTEKKQIDLLIIAIPAPYVPNAIKEAEKNGVKNAIIISAGFKETGNNQREQEVLENKGSMRILGPNCLGLMTQNNVNASFAVTMPKKGSMAFISQSGAVCTAALSWAEDENIGFSHFISLGNKADIDETDLVPALAVDPNVKVISLYLESLKDGKKWLEIIKKCPKPIVILEPGASQKAAEASGSHTGALAPNYAILKEAYRTAGAHLVQNLEQLLQTSAFLDRTQGKRCGKNTAIITNAGGLGVLMADLCETQHINLKNIPETTKEALKTKLPKEASVKNPIDVIGDAKADRYQHALEILIQEKTLDSIIVVVTPQATTEPVKTANAIAEASKRTNKTIIAVFTGGKELDDARNILKKEKIPVFTFPNEALSALGQATKTKKGVPIQKHTFESQKDIKKILKEASAGLLSDQKTRKIFEIAGLPVPPAHITGEFKEAEAFFKECKCPVVLKLTGLAHKTEFSGVKLNINTTKKLKNAWQTLTFSAKQAKVTPKFLIQPEIPAQHELFMGFKRDKTFGDVMLFGTGGIYSEVWKDTSITILPEHNWEETLQKTKIGNILSGVRGKKGIFMPGLIELFERLQWLFSAHTQISEIDLNPVLIDQKGRPWCVDVKINIK